MDMPMPAIDALMTSPWAQPAVLLAGLFWALILAAPFIVIAWGLLTLLRG